VIELPVAPVRVVPWRVLAERIDRFLPELFAFVEFPDVPAENNAAEQPLHCSLTPSELLLLTISFEGSIMEMDDLSCP